MSKPIIKIALPPDKYAALETLASSVIGCMTGNVNFPVPSPSMAVLQNALAELTAAIAIWGPAGSRGSKKELAHLRHAAITMRNLLLKEAAYVMNLVDLSAGANEQEKFILSSGFPLRNERSPQGVLEKVQNFHNFVSRQLNVHQVKLKWDKPLNVAVNSNVKVYLVYRSATTLFSEAVFMGATTKTTFIDNDPLPGVVNSYFVIPFNNAGNGVVSEVVSVSVPL